MPELKLEFKLRTRITLSDEAQARLLDIYYQARTGKLPEDAVPEGILAAVEKLDAYADHEVVLRTIVGETSGVIFQNELPAFYPEEFGLGIAIERIEYQEQPVPLDPPATVQPQVVHKGDRFH